MKESEAIWRLHTALELVRDLEDFARNEGWHVALAGGVLTNGWSRHDLDVIFYPRDATDKRTNSLGVHRVLRAAGLRFVMGANDVRANWRKKGSTDTKHVEVWRYNLPSTGARMRVDVIVLKGGYL